MVTALDMLERKTSCIHFGQMNLLNEIRTLWIEHVLWTRTLIISIASGLMDQEAVTARLLRNPTDFANVLEIYYGKEKANIFRNLLEEHLKIGGALVTSAKEGNAKAVEQYTKKWYDNADEIADFLALINPFWDRQTWQNLLYEHLKMTTDLAVARISGEYTKDIVIFDMIQDQALEMADYMATGIIKQFRV
ncbi:acetylglutamate kinase [Sinanaerobacter chloroacetimidivorans]|nr:acetylglutamate kinase [Sinanaerobacter chloroacetimidivorans]